MTEIATSEHQLTLIYNGESIRGKKVLALAKTKELPIREIDVMTTPLTGTQLLEIARKLNLNISELVNMEHPYFINFIGHHDFNEVDWLKLIEHNPQILKQPIAIRGNRTILVKMPNDILAL